MRLIGAVMLAVGAECSDSVPYWYHMSLDRTRGFYYKDFRVTQSLKRASAGWMQEHEISLPWIAWWRAMCIEPLSQNRALPTCVQQPGRRMSLVSEFPRPITIDFPSVVAIRSFRGAEQFLVEHGWINASIADLKSSAHIQDIKSNLIQLHYAEYRRFIRAPLWFKSAVLEHAHVGYVLERAATIEGGLQWISGIPHHMLKLFIESWKWVLDDLKNHPNRALVPFGNEKELYMLPSLSKSLFHRMFAEESPTRKIIRSMVDALAEYPLLSQAQIIQCMELAGGFDPEVRDAVVERYLPVVKSLSRMSIWVHGTLMASNNDIPVEEIEALMKPVQGDIFTITERLELWDLLCVRPLKNPAGRHNVPCAANFKQEVQLSVLNERMLYWDLRWILLTKANI